MRSQPPEIHARGLPYLALQQQRAAKLRPIQPAPVSRLLG